MTDSATRTIDKSIYTQESRYREPKENFKMIARRVRESGSISPGCRVVDVGCAAGEFVYFLRQEFPEADYCGVDVVPELLEKARTEVPGVDFRPGSVLDRTILKENSVDVTFLVGVIGIFDQFEPVLDNLIYWTRPGGRVFVFNSFNPQPYDVWVKFRPSSDANPGHRETGYNYFSTTSISRYLDRQIGAGAHIFHHFVMPIDLPKHPTDPVRTFTIQPDGGERLLINGLGLIRNQELLEIRVP